MFMPATTIKENVSYESRVVFIEVNHKNNSFQVQVWTTELNLDLTTIVMVSL